MAWPKIERRRVGRSARGVMVFAVGLIVSWALLAGREPRVQGRALAEWADQYGTNRWVTADQSVVSEAERAINSVHESALPVFLGWLGSRELAVKSRLRSLIPAQWHLRLRLTDGIYSRRQLGSYGLSALGTNVAAALPAIIEIARNHPDEDGRYVAVFTLRSMGGTAEPAIPFLVECLTNSSGVIREDAALGLGYLGLRPDLAVPALTAHLARAARETRPFELHNTIQSLGLWGTNAVAALPLLEPFQDHADAHVAIMSRIAIRSIAPPSPAFGPRLPYQ